MIIFKLKPKAGFEDITIKHIKHTRINLLHKQHPDHQTFLTPMEESHYVATNGTGKKRPIIPKWAMSLSPPYPN